MAFVRVRALLLSAARCDLPSARRDDGFEPRDVLTSRNHELVADIVSRAS